MNTQSCVPSPIFLGLLALVIPGVSALSDEGPIIASGTVAGFMLLIVITIIVYSLSANSWIRTLMKRAGKVKMPRWYFLKKKEAKNRLVAESNSMTQDTYVTQTTSSKKHIPQVNGIDRPAVPVVDKASMIQGWNQNASKVYEEKGYTLDLGDENEDEFRIETTIVDNEVLDVGPYTHMDTSNAKPVDGNVYSNPYLYSDKDRVTVTKSSEATGGIVSNMSNEMQEYQGESSSAFVNIEDKLIRL